MTKEISTIMSSTAAIKPLTLEDLIKAKEMILAAERERLLEKLQPPKVFYYPIRLPLISEMNYNFISYSL